MKYITNWLATRIASLALRALQKALGPKGENVAPKARLVPLLLLRGQLLRLSRELQRDRHGVECPPGRSWAAPGAWCWFRPGKPSG